MRKLKTSQRGFTLVELITVVAIVGILAMVATPSIANFVASGQQQSRSNIARTLYVAAQNRLTELQVSKSLLTTLTERYYTDVHAGTLNDLDRLDAASALGSNFPATDAANAPFVRYISKAAGDTDPTHPVNVLLAPVVVDPSILNNAICIEYNIQTGVVLSVFYSDVVDKLVYSDTVDNANLIGERPYTHAADRRQGYYGVDNTGVAAPTDLPDVVEIYDGATKPVETGRDNLLYAEIYLPRAATDKQRTIAITSTGKKPLYELEVDLATVAGDAFTDTLTEAVTKAGLDSGKHILYCASSTAAPGSVVQYGIDISASYERYIWVLDYVDGDQINDGIPHNIQTKYKDNKQTADPADDVAIGAQDLRVWVQRTAADKPVVSLSKANALYLAQTGLPGSNRYTVATARHLSNIRHNPAYSYHQTQSVRLGAISNFEPLPTFTGEYVAKGGPDTLRITGLVVDTTGLATPKANVGLFTEIGTTGSVLGLSLENATITAQNSSNVGSIAGVLNGKLRLSNSFANVTATNRAANVGGLVGSNNGQLQQSYNGGYYDATGRKPAPHYGSVSSSGGGNVGGLVGLNAGTVESSYNNARVNVQSVTVSSSGTEQYLSQNPVFTTLESGAFGNFGGLAGQQAAGGKLVNCYTTNFVASYSSPSRSGGIVGDNLGGTGTGMPSSYYLSNGFSNPGAKSKADLRTAYGTSSSIFDMGAAYSQGQNDADNYPYPVLSDNKHLTGYEDIWEKTVMSTVRLQYYEVYQNPDKKPTDPDGLLWGFQAPDGSSSLRQDLLAVSDGYCIDFGYGNSYTFTIASPSVTRTFTLNDTRNNADNPQWEWAASSSSIPDSLPVAYKLTDGTTRYRLFFRNYDIESFARPNSNTSLQFTATSRSVVLDRQSFSPYFAASFGSALKNYTVRTPRQLDNIDRVAITQADQPPEVYGNSFTQKLDIDFAVYYRELTLDSADGIVTLDRTTPLAQQGSIVDAVFNGSYDGQHHFIRHMELQEQDEDTVYDPDADPATNPPGDNARLSGRGLFAEIGKDGSVRQLALLRSSVAGGKRSLGGIAGVLQAGGSITECELSEVTVHDSGKGNSFIGGVVGKNQGTLQDVYFNSTNRDSTGLYATPITGSNNAGGLVGHNSGNLRRCYTTALAPGNSPIVGNGTLKDGSTAYYLSALGYNNFTIPKNKGEPIGPEPSHWREAFVGKAPDIWELSTNVHTTKDTELCAGIPYSYPKLKGTDHYYDWPILATLLKYYERYDDLSYGYYYYINQYAEVDTLRYDPERTVIEEGYLISTLTTDNYDIKLTPASGPPLSLTDVRSQLMDGQRVIKLLHSDVEALSSVTASGISYAKVEASARVDKNDDKVVDANDFVNELAGLDPEGFVWFNARFARAIALTDSKDLTAAPQSSVLTVRSPRHLLQMEANAALKTDAYSYNQTCSINMTDMAGLAVIETGNGPFRFLGIFDRVNTPSWVASQYGADAVWAVVPSASGALEFATVTVTQVLSDRTVVTVYEIQLMDYGAGADVWAATTDKYVKLTYLHGTAGTIYSTQQDYADADIDKRPPLPATRNHLVTGTFNASYNAQYAGSWRGRLQSDTERLGSYRINSLVMNADTEVAGMFQLIGEKGRVRNLELVDAQMRFSNGLGGGTLAATCSGQVTNIRVWHTAPTYLFADSTGTSGNIYCSDQQDHQRTAKNGYRHVHGGLVGHLTGPTALISECVVGTSDNTLEQVVENNTQISCFTPHLPSNGNTDQVERAMIPMGGIVGQADRHATIMSCTNIATITSNSSKGFPRDDAPWQMGGIAGRLGLYRLDVDAVSESASVYGCYNAGSVRTSAGWAGGVVSRANGNASIVSCYNTGRINVYTDSAGELQKTTPQSAIRIAGILAESNQITKRGASGIVDRSYPFVSACYNIGYVSDVSGASNESRSGAIIGLPGFGNVTMTSSFSLKANKYAPVGITGASYGGGMVNEQTRLDIFATWESRAAMRSQPDLLTRRTANSATAVHLNNINRYPFSPSTSSFYIFPEFTGSSYGGITIPSNRHFTPWEYIDAVYDTTLKYYEKYSDASFGYYYLDMAGKAIDTLAANKDAADSAKLVVEDGYLLELGKTGHYDVQIGDQTFTVEAKAGLHGDATRIGILFTEEMVAACQPGYNRIRLFTRLGHEGGATDQDREDDTLNRIVGSTSATNLEGIDLYFDYSFAKELRYGTVKNEAGVTTGVPPVLETNHLYEIRSIRHLIGIGKLTQAATNLTPGKVFSQTRELAASSYQYTVGAPAGYTKSPTLDNATYPGVLVQGGFAGGYDGNNHAITGLRLQGAADADTVGIFAQNDGTITRVLLQSPTITSLAGSGSGLTMGTVAAVNNSTINIVALYQPTLVGSPTANSQVIGGVVGINEAKGNLTDLLLVSDAAGAPVGDGLNPAGGTLGGMAGHNKGTVSYSVYLAPAPGSQPIVGQNQGSGTAKTSVYYLGGRGYNQFDPGENAGAPKSTAQFAAVVDVLSQRWGQPPGSPYPWLLNMPAPTHIPSAVEGLAYTLAYYEQYEDNSYRWYYNEDDAWVDKLDATNNVKIIAQGYAALLRDDPDTNPLTTQDAYDPAVAYTVRFGSHTVSLPAGGHTGLVVEMTTDTGKKYQAVLQSSTATPIPTNSVEPLLTTINGFEMQNSNSYFNPGFAKAIGSSPTNITTVSVRNEQQLLNLTALLATMRGVPTIKQERSLDLSAYPLTASVVDATFSGSYDGGYRATLPDGSANPHPVVIRNLSINYTPNPADPAAVSQPVGLFRESYGTIQNLYLTGTIAVQGGNNVGTLVGRNQTGGTITDCVIDAKTAATDLLVKGLDAVGGVTGLNNGTIQNITLTGAAADASIGNIVGNTTAVGGIAGTNGENSNMHQALRVENICVEAVRPAAADDRFVKGVGVNGAADSHLSVTDVMYNCFFKAAPITIRLFSDITPFAASQLAAPDANKVVEQELAAKLPKNSSAGISALNSLGATGLSALQQLRSMLVPTPFGLSPLGGSGLTGPSGASGLSGLPGLGEAGRLMAPRNITFILSDLPPGYSLDNISIIEPGEHRLSYARYPQLNGCIFTTDFTDILIQFSLVPEDESQPTYQYSILLNLTEP